MEEKEPMSLTKKLGITALILAIITVLLSIYAIFFQEKKVIVEDFSGKTVQDVMSWVDSNDLEKEQYQYVYLYSEDKPKDKVLTQSIAAETRLTKEDKIVFEISKGYNPDLEIEMPDMSKMTRSELEKFFKDNKFSDYTFEYVVDKKIAKEGFVKINNTNAKLKRSDLIVITLSIGPENVGIEIVMPNFKNTSKTTINEWCKENNIKCKFNDVFSDDHAKGNLISQDPAAETHLLTGGNASFKISLGRGIEIIDLTGKEKAAVEKWQKETDAKIQIIEYYAEGTEKGKVISTNPKAGMVTPNTTIKVFMSLGKPVVPDFKGKKEADIKKWIDEINKSIYEKANYLSYKLEVDNTSKEDAGTILSTNPKKDEIAPFKTVITVKIAGERFAKVESKSNITLDEFKTYLKGLEMELGDKTKEVYSDVPSGKLVRSDAGEKKVGTAINYVVSLGAYNPTASSFDNKTGDEIKSVLKTANDKEAGGWSVILAEAYSDTVAKGKTFGCTTNTSTKDVSCKVSKGAEPKPIVINNDYVGKTKGEFTTYLSGLGLTGSASEEYSETVSAGNVIAIVTGTYYAGNTVKYVVSLGQDPANKKIDVNDAKIAIINAYPKDGMTVETTKGYISGLLNEWGFTNYTFEEVSNDEPAGTLLGHNLTTGSHKKDIAITVQISKGI